jgi:hypothetical protein
MPEKPSTSEEEYFHKRDQELIAKRRAEAEAKRREEERQSQRELHHMHCPKCGARLVEERYHEVAVDRCTECRGIWFDAGEAESLLDKEPGAAQSFFGDLLKSFGGGKKKS